MTNRDMVKDPKPGGPKLPEPNVPKPEAPVPAPEDDPYLFTTNDPVERPHSSLGYLTPAAFARLEAQPAASRGATGRET